MFPIKRIVSTLFSLAIAFLAGGITIYAMGKNPFAFYASVFRGAFIDWGFTLFNAASLIMAGLAVALGFHCGMFNIGANGQIMIGSIFMTYIAISLADAPAILLFPTAVLASFIGGAIWGFIPGVLKARRGTNEVVVTIMMNYMAIGVVSYLLTYPLKATSSWISQSDLVPEKLWLPRFNNIMGADPVIIGAMVLALLFYILMWKTKTGYEIRATGLNPVASEFSGIDPRKTLTLAFSLSGGIAGLSYFNYIFGYQHRAISDVLVGTNVGFDAITVALLGKNHPVGIVLSSLLLSILYSGGMNAQFEMGVPNSFYLFFEGVLIFCIILFEKILGGKR